jgi:hypothetical protein
MAKQTPPNQTLALLAILLLMAGFGGTYYFLLPGLITARTQEAAAVAKSDGLAMDISTLKTAESDILDAKAELTAKNVRFDQIRSHFPLYEEVPSLYLQMESIVANSADIKQITYQIGQPTTDVTGEIRVPLTVTGVAPYATLKTFLVKLQNNIRPISLTQVAFAEYKSTDKNIPAGSYQVTVAGYVRAEKLSPSYSSTLTK